MVIAFLLLSRKRWLAGRSTLSSGIIRERRVYPEQLAELSGRQAYHEVSGEQPLQELASRRGPWFELATRDARRFELEATRGDGE